MTSSSENAMNNRGSFVRAEKSILVNDESNSIYL